jgi:hypothetical protein
VSAGATAGGDLVDGWFSGIKHLFPPAVKWRVQSDVPVIDETTGQMVDIASAGTRTDIVATAASGVYSAASGVVVTWRTTGVRNGRRVRGRTFLVPTANVAYENDGTIVAGAISSIGTANATLLGGVGAWQLGVWARPTAVGATDGIWHEATSSTIPDKVAVLRSRRD